MHRDEVDVDERLVRWLLTTQTPQLADRSLAIVTPWGTDNAIWRLGDDLVVRLPRIDWAAGQPDHDARWLPHLAPHLPVAVPAAVAIGDPGFGYPYRWAVHGWLPGEPATFDRISDPLAFARDIAAVVGALRLVPTVGAPESVGRARPLAAYDDATRTAIHGARHLIDVSAALTVWEEALAADRHAGSAVWVHGDLDQNCLLVAGRLSGVVDWGSACVGDPAADVQVVWSGLFTDASRAVFLDSLEVDEATIARSRGAAVSQACAALPYYLETYPLMVERSWHRLAALGVDPA